MKEHLISSVDSELVRSYSLDIFLVVICQNNSSSAYRVRMEFYETSLVLNYVFVCSRVLDPLRKRVSNKCMGTHTYIRNFDGKWYLARLETLSCHSYSTSHVLYSRLYCPQPFASWQYLSQVGSFDGHVDLSWLCLPQKSLLPLSLLPLTTNTALEGQAISGAYPPLVSQPAALRSRTMPLRFTVLRSQFDQC